MLTDVCREIATTHAQDDPLECGQQWGMIQNRNVKVSILRHLIINYKLTSLQRRTGACPPPPPAASAPKAKAESTIPAKRPLEKAPMTKKETKVEDSKPQPSSASDSQTSSKPAAKPAAPKREKSDLFSSFAKAKPKQKKATAVSSMKYQMALHPANRRCRPKQLVQKMVSGD